MPSASALPRPAGRKARVVRDARGRRVYELRAKPDSADMDSLNITEKQAFMDGRKLVAIVSDAASTGGWGVGGRVRRVGGGCRGIGVGSRTWAHGGEVEGRRCSGA